MFNPGSLKNAVIIITALILSVTCPCAGKNEEGAVKMDFVRIPAGSFYMGSPSSEGDRDDNEGPVHEVRITRPFYMGKYEVTQSQWKTVMGTTLRQQRDKADISWRLKGEGPEHPMYYVSWAEAVEFCKRLGDDFRLPTEAEWEYACRAGSQTRFYYGDDPNKSELSQYAWWWDNSDIKTHPVGQKKPNGWGLYDMHGNVREWCSDRERFIIGYSTGGGLVDTTGLASAKDPYHVCRGNSWLDKWGRGSAERGWGKEYFRFDDIGFRVVYTGRTGGDKQLLEITLQEEAVELAASPAEQSESRPRIIAGIVRDESGQQIDRASIWIIPKFGWVLRNYEEGTFEMAWHPSKPDTPMNGYHLVAYNKKRNLAMGMEIDRGANTLDIQLKPGVILTGKVVDSNGEGIKNVDIFIYLQTSDWRPSSYMYAMGTDDEGRFEISALPQGYDYVLSVHSSKYRTAKAEIHSEDVHDNRRDGILIVLQRGEFSISGIVVDTSGKPVPKMRVYCSAKGQPAVISHSDTDGKFTLNGVFKGWVKVIADGSNLYGSVDAEAGATNVRVVLNNKGAPPGKGRACFPAGTDVWVNGALVEISKVVAGQMVGKVNCAEQEAPFGLIESIEEHIGTFTCRDIVLENGNQISVVDAHCFMLDSGKWLPAQDLKAGLRLRTLNGTVEINRVSTRTEPFTGEVYNLKIKNSDYYAVGQDGVTVRDY